MPAKSSAQRRWAYGVKGKEWAEAHHFDTKGKLPEKLKGGKGNVGLSMYKAMQRKKK